MPDPKSPDSPADTDIERLDQSGTTDDTATTMRLRILDLEGELWPEDQGRTGVEDGSGIDPTDEATGDED